jgi:hypothetical protein
MIQKCVIINIQNVVLCENSVYSIRRRLSSHDLGDGSTPLKWWLLQVTSDEI